jgi:two-component system OmpR family response regulator
MDNAAINNERTDQGATQAAGAGRSKQRVLVVEDDQAILQALRIRLSYEGFDVLAVNNGSAALHQAQAFDPDVAVLDINMPGIDGIAVGERLQQERPDCRLLFLTASRDGMLRERAEQLNVHAYMEKPYGSKDLVESIRQCARGSR